MGHALTRRAFLQGMAASAAAALSATTARAASRVPHIRGALWWYDPSWVSRYGLTDWRAAISEQQEIRFDLLWLCGTASAAGDLQSFRELVRLCERRRMKILVDTSSSAMWYGPCDVAAEKDITNRQVKLLAPILKDSPSFVGWYVPHEIYWCEKGSTMHRFVHEFYPAAVDVCRKATEGLPVTVSPFFILDSTKVFGDFRVPSYDAYERFWRDLNRRAGFDVIMLQDSGEHFSWVTNAQRRPWFEAMLRACRSSGARLWGNVECAEMHYDSIEQYVQVNGRVHHSQCSVPRWRPVPLERLVSKMELADGYCEHLVTWGYREFCRPELGVAAKDWYNGYMQHVKRG